MNALLVLDTVSEKIEAVSKETLLKVKRREDAQSMVLAGSLAGSSAAFLVTGTPMLKEDNSVNPLILVGSVVVGFIAGGLGGLTMNHMRHSAFYKKRRLDLLLGCKRLLEGLLTDKETLMQSFNNLFESYVDGYQIETEIYDNFFKLAEAKTNFATLCDNKKALDIELNDLIILMGNAYGDDRQTKSLLAQKSTVTESLRVVKTNYEKAKTLIAEEQATVETLKRNYLITLANRKAKTRFNSVFIQTINDDIRALRELMSDIVHESIFEQEEELKAILTHHEIIKQGFESLVHGFDKEELNATSQYTRIKRRAKHEPLNMTYSGAPFYKLFGIAESKLHLEKDKLYEFDLIREGAFTDASAGLEYGTWLKERNYTEVDAFSAIFSKEEKAELFEMLFDYTNEPIEEGTPSVHAAYRALIKDNHSDTNNNSRDEVIARASTLMKRYKRYLREKEAT